MNLVILSCEKKTRFMGIGWLLKEDWQILQDYQPRKLHFVYALHRSDILYKANEPALKELAKELTAGLAYDHEPLQYLLIDGQFHGASVGHFRNGPYDLNDIVCDLPDAGSRQEEIVQAVRSVNFGKAPLRFMGRALPGGDTRQE